MTQQQIKELVITSDSSEQSVIMAKFICMNEIFHLETEEELISYTIWAESVDYLTVNRGRDGNLYAWYFDGSDECCVSVDTLEIIPESQIEEQFL